MNGEELRNMEKEIIEVVYNRFNSYPFGKRFKMAVKLLFKKLQGAIYDSI